MGRKVLQVLDHGYRCTIEEQDDPVLWITAVLKGAGADTSILLRGTAVNYAVKGQDASGLSFGGKAQTQPAKLDEDVAKIVGKGIEVYVVEEDVAERGLERGDLVAGVKHVSRSGVAKLFSGYDQIWHW
jgi:hypothetical protein